eukprot:5051428-Prymnesium_polylepis.2
MSQRRARAGAALGRRAEAPPRVDASTPRPPRVLKVWLRGAPIVIGREHADAEDGHCRAVLLGEGGDALPFDTREDLVPQRRHATTTVAQMALDGRRILDVVEHDVPTDGRQSLKVLPRRRVAVVRVDKAQVHGPATPSSLHCLEPVAQTGAMDVRDVVPSQ